MSQPPIAASHQSVPLFVPARASHTGLSTGSTPASLTFWIQWLVGCALTLILLCGLTLDKNGEIAAQYRVLALLTLLASVPAYSLARAYQKQHGYLSGLARIFAAWVVLLSGLAIAGFVTKTGALFSREVILQWTVLGFGVQALAFMPLHYIARHMHQQMRAQRRALVLGTGALAQQLADRLTQRGEPLAGLVASKEEAPGQLNEDTRYRLLGTVSQLRQLLTQHDICRLYVVLPLAAAEEIQGLYIDLLDSQVDVVWVPDLQSMMLLNHSVSDIGGLVAINLNESPLTAQPSAALLKAAMDRALALLAIIALSPVLLATAIAVKLSSPGPILFRQNRHGWNGKIIQVWKFRSMRMHDDKEVKQATREDPRITRVGRFIRRSSIDELPQLFNVLQGRMSLVGPRPHAVAHNNYYTGKITAYMARHRIKPGITGLAQISGCRGETETLEKMARRVELDLTYINHWSLWLDIKILIKTPFTLLSKEIY